MLPQMPIPKAFGNLFEPHRLHVFHGGRGGGKCLGLGTPVLMFDGSNKNVEEIKVGEKVMGPDNLPRVVLTTTRGVGELYEIKQTSAMTYIVNEEHILSLKKSAVTRSDLRINHHGNARSPNGRYPFFPAITNIKVTDVIRQSKRWKLHFRGYRAGLIRFPKREVTIDPYFLGVWLGDGTSQGTGITSMDSEIVDYCEAYCSKFGLHKSVYANVGTRINNKAHQIGFVKDKHVLINPLFRLMKSYDLIKNKHIPEDYIVNDEDTRLRLLAGFIDTDGTLHNNTYIIHQTKEHLARGIKRIADSLGFRTKLKKKKTICTNNGVVGECWGVTISGNAHRIPCLLTKKRITDAKPNKDFLLSQISIEPIGVGEYAGFTLDGDHLFCLADGTVTHNSESVARYLLWAGMKDQMTILCAREFQSSMRESVHQLLSSLIEQYTLQEFYKVKETEIVGENGTKFIFMGLRKNVENIKSIPNIKRCWVEESETVSSRSWDVLMPTIRGDGSEIILTFNPDIEDSPTYQRYVIDPPSYAVVRKVNYDENPFFPEVLRTEMEEMKAKDEAKYRHIWLGEPRATVEGAIFQREMQKAHEENRITNVPYDDRYPVSCFFDLGWADNTSIWFLQVINHEFRVIDAYQSQFQRTSHYIDEMQKRKYRYDRIVLPHDADNEHPNADRTWLQIVRQSFPNATVYAGKRVPIETRLEAAKNMFQMLQIDKQHCGDGLAALARYHFAIDPDTGKTSREPFHGPESNYADAFCYMCLEMREAKKPLNIPKRKPLPEWAKRTGCR